MLNYLLGCSIPPAFQSLNDPFPDQKSLYHIMSNFQMIVA